VTSSASRAEEVLAASKTEEVTPTVAAPSAGDVDPSLHEAHVAAIAARPPWSVAVDAPPLRCQAPRCEREATAYALILDRAYCVTHAQFAARTFRRRIVPLVDCARCRRQGPVGLALAFEGEDVRKLCRGCAELVRELVEEGTE